jgi:signal transduction histidine kinase
MFDPAHYLFNPHAAPILIVGISTLGLGLLAYKSNKASAANRHFLLLCLSISIWLCATAAGLSSRDPGLALQWFKLDNVGVMYISVAFYAFSMEFLGLHRPRLILLGYSLASLFALTIFSTDKFVTSVHEYWWGYFPQWGPHSIPFFLVFFTYMAMAFTAYFQAYRESTSPIKRNQIKHVLIAFLIAYTGSVDFLPAFGYAIYPFGYIPIFILISVITYAILRYRLMDISLVINKGLAYALLLGLIFVPVYLIAIIGHRATFYSIPPLLVGTLIFACGLWIVLENPRTATNRTFYLLCTAVCMWLFGLFLNYSSSHESEALLWEQFVYAGVVFIPALFDHFRRSFLKEPPAKGPVAINYFISTMFLLLIPTPYLLDGHYHYYWGYYPKAGILHPLFLVYFAWVSGLSLHKLYRSYKEKERSGQLEARREKYVFWAFTMGYLASIDFVQSYGVELYPFGWVFASTWILTVTYAIVKHQVMDIALIASKPKILPFAQAVALLPFYVMILLLLRFYTGTTQFVLAGILVAIFSVFAGLLVNLRQRMERVVEKALFKSRSDAYETLIDFSRAMVSILDLQTLYKEITATLAKVMGIRKVSLFILDKEKDAYCLRGAHGAHEDRLTVLQLKSHDPFVRALRELDQPIVKEELEHGLGFLAIRDRQMMVDMMTTLESELCVPLINKERLIGFLNLGSKSDQHMYSQEDLNLLFTLGHNAAIALDNAMLYEDLRRSQNLMRRTDRLRSLETIAGGFAHEIRNPLTSIKTFVQLAPERRGDSEFLDHFSKVVSEDVERIERLIQEILDYARYMEPKFMEEDLNDVVASCLYFIEVKAENKSILVEKDLAPDLPRVKLDRQQIKQVLLNLFLNAMEAMHVMGGRLTVKTYRIVKPAGESWVQIEVADTGSGIPAENLEHIFDPFYTTKHESGQREGTGLGLSIVHQIVGEHHGCIEVQSTVGRGTTFFVSLPANPAVIAPQKEHAQHEKTGFIGR